MLNITTERVVEKSRSSFSFLLVMAHTCISHFDFLGQFFQVLNYRASNTGVECRTI